MCCQGQAQLPLEERERCADCVNDSSYPGELREKCDAFNARHGAERVARCWGAGAGMRFDQTKDAITSLLQVVL